MSTPIVTPKAKRIEDWIPPPKFDLSFIPITPYKGHPKLRPPGVTWEWPEDVGAEYLKCATDCGYFIEKYVKIVTLDHGLVPFQPFEYQEKIIDLVINNRKVMCRLSRQSGKTTVLVALLLWHVLFNRRYQMAVVANKENNAIKILASVKLAYEHLPAFLQQGIVEWNKKKIELENGSYILCGATSSAAIRGGSFNFVYMDEFCHIHRNMQDEFWMSVLPTISAGADSKVIMTSTPKGFDKFWEMWTDSEKGRNEFKRITINWWDKPGRDQAWKDSLVPGEMSEEQFAQEYNVEFLGSSGTLINGRVLNKLEIISPIEEKESGLRIYEKPQVNLYDDKRRLIKKGHEYVVTVDVSRGVMLDHSGVVVTDITELPYRVVAVYQNNTIDPFALADFVYNVACHYNNALVVVENNDMGGATVRELMWSLDYDNVLVTVVKGRDGTKASQGSVINSRLGVKTENTVKKIGCATLKSLIENWQLVINDAGILFELGTFVATKTGTTYKAEEGRHDDLVMCLVLFAWLTKQPTFQEMTAHDLKKAIVKASEKMSENDLIPFGMVDRPEPAPAYKYETSVTTLTADEMEIDDLKGLLS